MDQVWATYYDKKYPSDFVKACEESRKRQEEYLKTIEKNKPKKS